MFKVTEHTKLFYMLLCTWREMCDGGNNVVVFLWLFSLVGQVEISATGFELWAV